MAAAVARQGPDAGARVTRDDFRQMLRDIPAAIVVLGGLWAFCALLFAVAG